MKGKIFNIKKGSLILCATLFFLLFFGPFLNKWAVIPILLLGLSGKIIESKKTKRYFAHFVICLLVPVIAIVAACLVGLFHFSDKVMVASVVVHIGIAAFFVLYATDSLRELMASHQTNVSEVLGALNTYIILGLIYGEIYALIAHFQHGAFSIAGPLAQHMGNTTPVYDSWIYIYFSFITQTSLGYGDVTPISHLAQVVVISQTIFGQFYIAIVLAYLLHNYITNDKRAS
ncbi:MAG: ion channel [Chthoniobacterales bacterium]